MPLSGSGTEKRQFQPAKNPGKRFLLSSLDGAAIALTRPFLYFRLENKILRETYVCVPAVLYGASKPRKRLRIAISDKKFN